MVEKIEKSNDKIVVLNSGGFDSIVLVNYLAERYVPEAIHSLHFRYGAKNEKQQEACVDKVCKKLQIYNKVIDLPKFDWTDSRFYEEGFESDNSQYLEYRNLVFLSYAVSFAESIGASLIYAALLKTEFKDTSPMFVDRFNTLIQDSCIKVVAPFIEYDKDTSLYGVRVDDFFSCDNPRPDGSPCLVCTDCEQIKEIKEVLLIDSPIKALYTSGYDYSSSIVQDAIKSWKIQKFNVVLPKNFLNTHGVLQSIIRGVDQYGADTVSFICEDDKSVEDLFSCVGSLQHSCSLELALHAEKVVNTPMGCISDYGFNSLRLLVQTLNQDLIVKQLGVVNTSGSQVILEIQLRDSNVDNMLDLVSGVSERRDVDSFVFVYKGGINKERLEKFWESLKRFAKLNIVTDFEVLLQCGSSEIADTSLLTDVLECESLYTSYVDTNISIQLKRFSDWCFGTLYINQEGTVFTPEEKTNTNFSNMLEKPLDTIINSKRCQGNSRTPLNSFLNT